MFLTLLWFPYLIPLTLFQVSLSLIVFHWTRFDNYSFIWPYLVLWYLITSYQLIVKSFWFFTHCYLYIFSMLVCKFCFLSTFGNNSKKKSFAKLLTLFRMGLSRAAHRWEGGGGGDGKKGSPRWNLSYISYNGETWHSYTLPKENQKNL